MAREPVGPDACLGPGHPDHEVSKANHFARNLRLNVVVEAFWGFGLALVSTYAILPVFLSNLGASKGLIALIPGIQLAGWALLQLPSAYFTTRLGPRTWPMFVVHLPPILAWGVLAFAARDFGGQRPELARALTLGLFGAASLSLGIAMPMWADYLNRQTPARTRGRLFGWVFWANNLAAFGGGYAARGILGRLPFPGNFSVCFYVAASAMVLGLLPYLFVREAAVTPMSFPSARAFVAHVWEALAQQSRLRRLLVARGILEAGIMAGAFYAVRALSVCRLPDGAAGTFTMILTATGVPAVLAFAYVGERVGFRLVMAAGGLCAALATATALVAGRPAHFYLVFVLSGLAASCDFLSAMNMVIELSPDRDKTVYQAIYNTVLVPGRIGYPLLAGFLAEQFGIAAVFRAALALQIAGVLAVVLLVREARGR